MKVIRKRLTAPITEKHLVYTTILTGLFTFLSFVFVIRVEPTEIEGIYAFTYGFPIGWLRIESHTSYYFIHEPYILWVGLVLNIIVYFLLSFMLVYLAVKLKEAI